MQNQASILLSVVLGVLLMSFEAWAGSSCSATNDNGDARCDITCPDGQAARCSNAVGSGTPTCECVDQSGGLILNEYTQLAQTACLRMYPTTPGYWGIVNNCKKCRKAVVSWCDGNIRRYNINANSQIKYKSCVGTITLVGENDC